MKPAIYETTFTFLILKGKHHGRVTSDQQVFDPRTGKLAG